MQEIAQIALENKEFIQGFWERISPSILKKTRIEISKTQWLFGKHLDLSYKKNSSVRLLCSKTTPTRLSEVYVPNTFTCKDEKEGSIADDIFITDIRDGKRVIVRGNGGSGKTFFLKHLWNKIFHDPRGQIPVFLELRKFNDFHTTDLTVLIKYTLTNGLEIDEEVFQALLKIGAFVFILDGFDEVQKDKRTRLEKEILKLENDYRNCAIVVSSRANEIFHGWANFYIYDVDGFDHEQVKTLVKKATVEEIIKKSFLRVLDENFYKKHRTFLKNPLLALMMLITFRDNASIPDNLNSFYRDAFQTLFQNHDATKEAFIRQKSLGIVEFQRVFSMFCLSTYLERSIEFSEAEFLSEIEEAVNFLNSNLQFGTPIAAEPAAIKEDIVESVNLMQLDGTKFTFIHRSFQEYFAAFYAIFIDSEMTSEFLEIFSEKTYDDVFKIAYQMKPAEVVNKYIIPKYKKYKALGLFEKPKTQSECFNYLRASSRRFYIYYSHPNEKEFSTHLSTNASEGIPDFLNFLNSVKNTILSEKLNVEYHNLQTKYLKDLSDYCLEYISDLKELKRHTDDFSHFTISFSKQDIIFCQVINFIDEHETESFIYEESKEISLSMLPERFLEDIRKLSMDYAIELFSLRNRFVRICNGLEKAQSVRTKKTVKDIYYKKRIPDIPY